MYPNPYYQPPGAYPQPGYYGQPEWNPPYPEQYDAGVSSYPEEDDANTSGCGCGNGTSAVDWSQWAQQGQQWAGQHMPQGWQPGQYAQQGMQWAPQNMPQGWQPGQWNRNTGVVPPYMGGGMMPGMGATPSYWHQPPSAGVHSAPYDNPTENV